MEAQKFYALCSFRAFVSSLTAVFPVVAKILSYHCIKICHTNSMAKKTHLTSQHGSINASFSQFQADTDFFCRFSFMHLYGH